MKHRFHQLRFSVLVVCVLTSLAACAGMGAADLRGSAHQLNIASNHLSVQAQYKGEDTYRGRISRYAESLSKAAEGFDRALRDGDSRDELEDQYRRVTEHYRELHDSLTSAGHTEQSEHLQQSFADVTAAYRQVQGVMSARLASERERMRY